MKYIIDLPDKEIREYVLEDRLTIPIQVGITKDCLSFDTGLKITQYDESDIEHARKEGQDETWELAREIAFNRGNIREILLPNQPDSICCVFDKFSYAEAREKYEAWKKQKDEIKIGDEVIFENGSRFIVYNIFGDGSLCGVGYTNIGKQRPWSNVDPTHVTKGRHFPEVAEALEKLRRYGTKGAEIV